jgi:hypothetical protein
MSDATRAARRMRIVVLVMALGVLIPSLYGFGTKFLEFVALYRGDVEGAFAISPILNYLLASLGFLCLFCWAITRGMFRDVEGPKYTLLENEARLDAGTPWRGELGSSLRREGLGTATHHNRIGDFYEHD